LKDRQEVVFPPQRVGRIGGTTRSYIPRTGSDTILEDEATYEYLTYIFNAGIYLATPTTDLSSAAKRSWSVQSASTDAFQTTDLATLVVENGDNVQAEIARFCYVSEYSLNGKQGEAVHISATLPGRAPETTTFTTVGTTDFENPFETILTSMGTLYIDPSTDTAGTTQKTLTLIDFDLKHTTGWVPITAKDGRKDFSDIKHIDDDIMLDVTFEHNSIAVAEKAAWRAQTERALRLTFLGNALSTTDAGATYDTKAFVIDLYGKWETFGAAGLEEQDGNNIYKGTFRAKWSATASNKASFLIVNELATLP